jgi:integrase
VEEYEDPLTIFRDALSNPLTRDRYEKRLDLFFRFLKIDGETLQERAQSFATRSKHNPAWCVSAIMNYMRNQKQRAENKEISTATLSNYYKPIKLFCEMNDIILNWKKITRGIPRGRNYASDRIPTIEEIKQLMNYPDRRLRPAILTMMSSGIRVGAWDYLRWGDMEPIYGEKDSTLIGAKLIVYRGEPEEYFTFITPEAYETVKDYIEFRANHGELISKSSSILRDEFDVTKSSKGIASIPKQLKSSGLKRLIERALFAQGIRKPLENGKRRHEFQADHGFRKYFKTVAERHMKSLHVEILMGHSIGLGDNYYRVSEKELLAEYLKAVPDLTVSQLPKSMDEERLKSMEREMESMKSGINELSMKLSKLENQAIEEYAKDCGLTVPELVKRIVMDRILFLEGGDNKEAPQYEYGPDLPDSVEDEFAKFVNKYRKKFALSTL